VIKDMHDGVVTMVRENWTRDRQRHFLYYRLKPRLALTPYLFAQVMHKLTRHIEDEVSFNNDIVLVYADYKRNDFQNRKVRI